MPTSCQRRCGDGCALLRDARRGRGMLGGGGITPTSRDGSDSPAEVKLTSHAMSAAHAITANSFLSE